MKKLMRTRKEWFLHMFCNLGIQVGSSSHNNHIKCGFGSDYRNFPQENNCRRSLNEAWCQLDII